MKPNDIALLVVLAMIWGSSYLFIRVAVPAFGPIPLVALRVSLAAVVLWIVVRSRAERIELRLYARRLLVLGAINAAIPFTLISAAELKVTASMVAILTAITPLWAAAFSAIWLGEPLTVRKAVAMLVGTIGVGILVGWSPLRISTPTVLALLAVIAATCSYGAVGVFTKLQLVGASPSTLALGQQLGCVVWLFIPATVQAPSVRASAGPILALIVLGVLCTAVAYLIFFRLLASVSATQATTVTYLIPVFGTAWGVIFLREQITSGMLVGLALILVSIVQINELRFGIWRVSRAHAQR